MNDLKIMVRRVQNLITKAKKDYPAVPIIVVGHSMGCGIVAELDLKDVAKVIFVAPTAGDERKKMVGRYGNDITEGMTVTSSDGLTKQISKEFFDSVGGIVWEDEYQKLLQRFDKVYVFESGDEEIVSYDRLKHRDMPFASYKIIDGAKHNYAGEAFKKLCAELDKLI